MALGKSTAAASVATTIPSMFVRRSQEGGGKTILRVKSRGIWHAVSWSELGKLVRRVSCALKAIGLRRGEVACILADAGPSWVGCELGILGAGGTSAALHATESVDHLAALIENFACRVIFVGGRMQLHSLLEARRSLPRLEHVVVLDQPHRAGDKTRCETFEEFLARGDSYDKQFPDAWQEGISAIRPDDDAIILFTSGTIGPSKAVVLTHRNVIANLSKADALFELARGGDRLSFLPAPHFMERIMGLHAALWSGIISNYVESAETVSRDMREVRPTVLWAPPFFWSEIHVRVTAAADRAGWLQRQLYRFALAMTNRALRPGHGEASLPERACAKLASVFILSNVRRFVGLDRLRVAGIGGAPVPAYLHRWCSSIGIDLMEFYGIAEFAGLVAAQRTRRRSSWQYLCGEIALSDEGEILVRGEAAFSRYWTVAGNSLKRSAAEWIATGDLGRYQENNLQVLGHVGDVVNTVPQEAQILCQAEAALGASPYINEAIVLSGSQNRLACVIALRRDKIAAWAVEKGLAISSRTILAQLDEVRDLIRHEIEVVNGTLAHPISAFQLIDQEFKPGDPNLTPIMRLRRNVVIENHRNFVEEIRGGS